MANVLPTPKQTSEMMIRMFDANIITVTQFRVIHHMGASPFTHFKYLGGIESYLSENSDNLMLHKKLEEIERRYSF